MFFPLFQKFGLKIVILDLVPIELTSLNVTNDSGDS